MIESRQVNMNLVYYVFRQNCIEDWYCEDMESRVFMSYAEALEYVATEKGNLPQDIMSN